MMRSVLIGTLSLLAFAATSGSALAGDTVKVTIDNFSFNPQTVTVKPGDTINWINQDDIPHNVREATAGTFKCKVMDTGEDCNVPFQQPGEYKYFCALHPHMTGTVIVKAP